MYKKFKITALIALGGTFSIGFGQTANALTFNLSYDSSVTNNLNAASIEGATQFVANEFSNLFTNNVTLNIDVVASSSISLGQSNVSGYYLIDNYNQVRSALINNTPFLANSPSSLPSSDPGVSSTFFIPNAEAKALGFTPQNAFVQGPDHNNYDGIFTFNPTVSYSFNKTNTGGYDFISLAEHELSEIMGRSSGVTVSNKFYATPYDLFSFTSPGVRSYNTQVTGAYFSLDNGNTSLNTFNNSSNGGDSRDWSGNTLDSFNAFSAPGAIDPLVSATSADIKVMNAIGWTSSSSTQVPEPLTIFGTLIGGIAAFRMRKKLKSQA